MSDSYSTIPTLDSTNYKQWSDAILAVVLRKGDVSVLNGTTPKPADDQKDELKHWLTNSQIAAGYILGSLSQEARVYITDILDGPKMWKELKDAYDQQTSAIRFNYLEALLSTTQAPGESLSSIMARVNSRWNDFIAAQSNGYDINKLNEELFCLALIRALDPAQHDALKHSLIKEETLTKSIAVTQIKAVENGLFSSKPSDSALIASNLKPSSTSSSSTPNVHTPCAWCISRGRSDVAQKHLLANCTGVQASIQHYAQRQSQSKSKGKGKQQAKEAEEQAQVSMEFAGKASSFHTSVSPISDQFWIPDSGATSCMTGNKSWICNMKPYHVPIRLGDDSVIYSEGVGCVWFEPMLDSSYASPVCFSRVLYVPNLKSNLLSTTFLTTQRGFKIIQEGSLMQFFKSSTLLFTATISNCVGRLNGRTLPSISIPELSLTATIYPHDLTLWHKRFGHRSPKSVEHAIKHSVTGASLELSTEPPSHCVACIAGKQHRDPFPSSLHTASRPMEIISCDLRGPFHVQTHSGKLYWAVFTDSYTRYRKLALLSSKKSTELLMHYKEFEAQGKARFGQDNSVLIFRCDGGGEFIGMLKDYLLSVGTEYQQTTRATPQQNGISERANRDIGEGIVSALVQSGLPDTFWGEAALAFVYVTNRFPTAPLGTTTPYERWYGHKPDVSHFRVWGCRAFVHIQRDQRTKTQSHTAECVFIGYPEDHKAWKFYNPKSRKVIISRDVIWDENNFLYPPKVGAPLPNPTPRPNPPQLVVPPSLSTFIDDDLDAPPSLFSTPTVNDTVHAHVPSPSPSTTPETTPEPTSTSTSAPSPTAPSPAPAANDDQASSRRSSRPKFKPVEYWKVNAPRIPYSSPAPDSRESTPTSTTTIPLPTAVSTPLPDVLEHESDEESDDPLALKAIEESLLTMAGIGNEYVEFSFDQAVEYAYSALETDTPTYKAAMASPDKDKWVAACVDEINSHVKNGTWKLVELPEDAKPIGSRWVLKIKRTEDGSVERFKARLVAQGFSQRPGWDYLESFAPTIRLSVVRTIFALVAMEDLECESVDITTAFLNGDLEEKIYMKLPDGFEEYTPSGKRLYALLCKAIYGLKQGARQWYLKLSEVMRQIGFSKVRSEPCVYIFKRGDDRIIVPCYVDDLHIACKSIDNANHIKKELGKHFQLRDLGPTKWFLGIHITRNRAAHTLSLSSRQYCLDMLEELGMATSGKTNTPMAPGLVLTADMCPQTDEEREFMKTVPYQRAVGKLNYLALTTRPDISFAVSRLARFSSNPGPEHWKAVKHLLRYINTTIDYKLTYGGSPLSTDFVTYSDADFARDPIGGKSTSGWVLLMAGAAISWSSKLQTRVAQSTTEAEYVAAESASREMAFLRHVLEDLHYPVTLPCPLAMDNQSAIAAAKNPEHQGRMKHIDPIYHGLRESVEHKEVLPHYVSTDDMIADILTKSLPLPKVKVCVAHLGLT